MNPPTIIVRRPPRRGAALVWALVVMGIVGVMSTAVAWQFAAVRRSLESRANRVQALWLARSGGELAAARLMADPNGYTGETVEPIPESQVRITVEKDAAKPETYHIRCEARYPVESSRMAGATLTWTATRRTDPVGVRLEIFDRDSEAGDADKGS